MGCIVELVVGGCIGAVDTVWTVLGRVDGKLISVGTAGGFGKCRGDP